MRRQCAGGTPLHHPPVGWLPGIWRGSHPTPSVPLGISSARVGLASAAFATQLPDNLTNPCPVYAETLGATTHPVPAVTIRRQKVGAITTRCIASIGCVVATSNYLIASTTIQLQSGLMLLCCAYCLLDNTGATKGGGCGSCCFAPIACFTIPVTVLTIYFTLTTRPII